jgi:photosystem II stability/assembly factor-like uncharacterized protein
MRTLGTWVAIAIIISTSSRLCAAPVTYPGDAAIRSVQFVDEREGWAVGDDGVIWHSIDGGANWESQSSGVSASLRAVHFLTPYSGWIVGRVELPGGGSRGVVLATTDGGLKWNILSTNAVPGLNYVKFFNQRNGVAAGDGSAAFPTGVFVTLDGGRTWRPVPGKRCPGWYAADFSDAENGALGGPWSQLATVREGYFGASEVDPLGGRSIRGLKLNGQFAVAVGQGGLILTSSKSAGMKWGFGVPNMPKEVLAACDFSAVATHGKHLWVVGRPGTFVLHSADLGQSWEMQKTGQTLPLHAVYFLNESHGWAAGEMGTLLYTRDGGKSWKVVKQDGQRLAALFVHASSRSIPLDAVALLGAEEGYFTAAMRFTSAAAPLPPARLAEDDRQATRRTEPTGSDPRLALETEKIAAAMRQVGGASGEALWQFPLPHFHEGCSAEQLYDHWDKLHGERASVQLLRQMVLAIRIWRPDVVVTDAASKTGDPAEMLLIEALKEAFKMAADPQAFPEQLSHLRLEAWAPKKLYALLDKNDPAAPKLPTGDVSTRLGDCPRDFAQSASALLIGERRTGSACDGPRCFQLLSTRLSDADTALFQGIALAHGGPARRNLPPLDADARKAEDEAKKAVQSRRTLELIVRGEAGPSAKPEQMIAELAPALKKMPGDLGARAAWTLANHYARAGQWVLAREAFLVMADLYPTDPQTLEAYRWLVRYQSSGEARRREELGHFVKLAAFDFEPVDAKNLEGPIKLGSDVVQTSATFFLRDNEGTRKWFQGSLEIEPRLRAFGPLYANDPSLQLCLQAARRQLGDWETPKKWLGRYLSESAAPLGGQTVVRGTDPWRDCAMAELWLSNRTIGSSPAKPIAYAPKGETRPNLDGYLDDVCWDGVQPILLSTTSGDLELSTTKDEKGKLASEYTARAWFTCDEGHLYVAVHCTHPAGKRVAPVEKRDRDMDLRRFDRVSIMLDMDRDYQTYYHLQIDQRGCLAEDCWDDPSWNPKWYVAVHSDDNGWTAEAAIPWHELTGHAPSAGNTWAVNVTRIVPGKGVQAWSTPADARPRPEGMGLLQFIAKSKQ